MYLFEYNVKWNRELSPLPSDEDCRGVFYFVYKKENCYELRHQF